MVSQNQREVEQEVGSSEPYQHNDAAILDSGAVGTWGSGHKNPLPSM